MSSDKKELFEILRSLDFISKQINSEIAFLKRRLNYSIEDLSMNKYVIDFYSQVLEPLFDELNEITLQDILKKTNKKPNTINLYLSKLDRYGYICKRKNNKGDKRTRIYFKNHDIIEKIV